MPFELINDLLLKATTSDQTIYSKLGSMVACHPSITFRRSFLTGGGLQDATMRSITNEDLIMMASNGDGDVYYAWRERYIKIISLADETLNIESDQVLAFEGNIQAGTSFVGSKGTLQGLVRGAVTGQGMFTTTLTGTGDVAIISDGPAVALTVTPENDVFVDPDAYLGHSGEVESKFFTDVSWKNLIGQSSGESFQLRMLGSGIVYIQASERR